MRNKWVQLLTAQNIIHFFRSIINIINKNLFKH